MKALVLLLLALLVSGAMAELTTNPADVIDQYTVRLNGTSNVTENARFIYGPNCGGNLTVLTANVSATAEQFYNLTIHGLPLVPGKTYCYRAWNGTYLADEENFTMAARVTLAVPTYTALYNEFMATDWNFSRMAGVIPKAYGVWGIWLWPVFWMGILGAVWFRVENARVPAFLFVLIAIFINGYFPPEVQTFVNIMLVLAFIGLFVILFRKVRGRG